MALASIDTFLNVGLTYNGARPSRFICSLTTPAGLSLPGTATNKFKFTCKAATVPAGNIGQVEMGYMGRKLKYSGDRTWDDWEATVILDQDYVTRDLFEAWLDSVNAVEDNVMADSVSYIGYKGSVDIMHLGQQNNDIPIGHYNLIGAWPSYVGPIQLNWDTQNAISEFNVRFAFDDMTKPTANPISGFTIGTSASGNTAGIVIPLGTT